MEESQNIIGKGSFAKVYIKRSMGRTFALKKLCKQVKRSREFYQKEVKILKACDHPNILKIYRNYSTDSKFCIEVEYLNGGDLQRYQYTGQKGETQVLKQWTREICSALKYLHEKGIVHKDLKAANCMLGDKGQIKLIDFGASIWLQDLPDNYHLRMGTPCYMAPEHILRQCYTSSVDMYALGVVLFELIHGYLPFRGSTKDEYWESTLRDEPSFGKNCPQEWKILIRRLLDKDGQTRISAQQLLVLLGVPEPEQDLQELRDVRIRMRKTRKISK